ncbi:MAG: hypothetical protein ACI4LS_12375, partial [Treponema sp.]
YFIEKGFFERHINRMRKDYCQKKELFANFYEIMTEFSNKFILNYSLLTKNEIEEAVKVLCEF